MPHTIHTTVVALEALRKAVEASTVSSQDVIDPPSSMSLATTSATVVAADPNSNRLVVIANIGPQDAFLALGSDAVASAGILLRINGDRDIPLGAGVSLHGITQMASADVVWQSFGKAT